MDDKTEAAAITLRQRRTRNALMLITGIVGLLTYLAIVLGLMFVPIPKTNETALNIVLGSAMGFAGMIFGYYFGSSKSSSDKNEIIKQKVDGTKNS